jgi:hypothetical protein
MLTAPLDMQANEAKGLLDALAKIMWVFPGDFPPSRRGWLAAFWASMSQWLAGCRWVPHIK